ncbi:hypothetical protein BDQ94DRAFT_162500 [Aspergillus welwitschiae]|uniref:Uncharacterized protein n=1 Tax=Aspergillus welwitschiae TaxID=1341132 RepID=A0A3F3PQ00_9EURO|nr:hypothetical protein BDQ94DRAFT_162500 [Aspergillus welwitschiae]RDH28898.1 hypothetical protein BDQ94DRAFT_162500 [Aspergillus welwitschiae]
MSKEVPAERTSWTGQKYMGIPNYEHPGYGLQTSEEAIFIGDFNILVFWWVLLTKFWSTHGARMSSALTGAMLSALDVKLLLSERQSIRFQAQSGRGKAIGSEIGRPTLPSLKIRASGRCWCGNQTGVITAELGSHTTPFHKVMINSLHNAPKFGIWLGTDALPGCIRTDSALAALMKAPAFVVGCRYVGVYTSVGGTFPAIDPDHGQRQEPLPRTNQLELICRGSTLRLTKPTLQNRDQRYFVRTSWCKIYAGACAMDRGFIRQGGHTAFATLGIEFQPTSLDLETAEITKRKGQCKNPDASLVKFWGGASGRASVMEGETRGSRLIAQHGVNDALTLSHSSALCDTGSCRSTVRRESVGSGVTRRHPLQTDSQSPFRINPPISFGQRASGKHGLTWGGDRLARVSSAEQGYQARGTAVEEPGGEYKQPRSPCQRRLDEYLAVAVLCRTNFILCPNPSAYYFSEFTEYLYSTSSFCDFSFLGPG